MTDQGEEWKAMDATLRRYDPRDASDIVARARRGIEAHRKRDVELRVVDGEGRALPHVALAVQQTRHEFPFGDQLWDLDAMVRFGEQDLDRCRAWRRRFADVLTSANALCYWTERPRNDGAKSEDRQGEQRLDGFAWCVDWARSEGLTVKGHPLFWPVPKAVPAWVARYDHATRMTFLEARVRSLVARFKGKVGIWDAVNEQLWEPAFKNLDQREWPHLDPVPDLADSIAPVLRWARDEDPDATFLVNDYGLEADPETGPPRHRDGTPVTARLQRQRMLALVDELAKCGSAPDGIGLQSHTGGWLDHREQSALYDEMASSGLPVHITEFWADTRHLDGKLPREEIDRLQAEYIANYLTCAFGHVSVDSFFFWGFMGAGVRWHGERSGHDITPTYERVLDLLTRQWRTSVAITTDSDGIARFRGFFGDYAIRFRTPLGPRSIPLRIDRHATGPFRIQAVGANRR
ncbi:MAG TPA: endo-1,4-beta-xylanase [Planctomycetota bacterium]|nr:endo-1,4-beta-xylanase [Planctomycetota bacterium]